MPTFMQEGVSWFTERMLVAAGRPVNHIRNGISTPLTAWVTNGVYETVDATGIAVEITTRDYKYKTADLLLEVRRGDRFTEDAGGKVHTVEVMALANDPAASWVDSDGTISVAHCKTMKIQ